MIFKWLEDRRKRRELLLLRAICDLGDNAYGFTIHNASKISLGSMYPMLLRLERLGLVNSHWGESTPQRGGFRKRMYTLTPTGLDKLKEIAEEK